MAFPIRNTQWASVNGQMIDATTGGAFSGTVTVYVDGDNTGQQIGSVGGGLATAAGHGLYSYVPAIAETDYGLVAFTFTGPGAIPFTAQIATLETAQQISLTSATGSTSKTVRTVLTAALKRINVIQANEVPTPDMLADAFDRMNDWIDSIWGNDRLAIYTITRSTWTLSSSKGTLGNPYLVGPGGDINITRPQFIDHVNFIDNTLNPGVERPLIPLTPDAWALLPIKTQTAAYPVYSYYEPTYSSAQGNLYLWLVPTAPSLQGVLYAPSQITAFATLDDVIALPPGYNRFLRDNVAVELAAEFRENVPIDPSLARSAMMSMAQVKRTNQRLYDMAVDPALLRHGGYRSNIYLG